MASTDWYTLAEHTSDMAALLASPWEADGPLRTWYAEYTLEHRVTRHISLTQVRGASGFQAASVTLGDTMQQRSAPGFSLAACAVWFGLELCGTPLDWHHEL